MKKILILLLYIIPFICFGQKTFKEYRVAADTCKFDSPLVFKYIDTVHLSKNIIYQRSYQWLASNTNNFQSGINMHDSLSGKIVIPDISSSGDQDYYYSLTIDIREGKYRLVFDNFRRKQEGFFVGFAQEESTGHGYWNPGGKKSFWQVLKYKAREESQQVFAQLSKFIGNKDDF